jgi:VWFA-related protein
MIPVIALYIPLLAAGGQVTFKSDTSLVNNLATVHDEKGRVVRGLTQADFRLEEDSQRQEIHDFTAQSNLPLPLALLVDTSRSMTTLLDYGFSL